MYSSFMEVVPLSLLQIIAIITIGIAALAILAVLIWRGRKPKPRIS